MRQEKLTMGETLRIENGIHANEENSAIYTY